jgi:hypothetical protein
MALVSVDIGILKSVKRRIKETIAYTIKRKHFIN